MAAPSVDTRKLKDSVAEYLRKSKFEKAGETLEQLVKLEPRDMTNRLKLGDTYRRTGHVEKAITCYQVAVKHFADEGQLIKAIGAVKVILEIDPKNEMAQRELAEMNNRRFARPTLEAAGLKPARGIGAGARGAATLELQKGPRAVSPAANLLGVGAAGPRLEQGDDEPLELDDGHPTPPRRKPAPPARPPPAPERMAGPPPRKRASFELSGGDDLPPDDAPLELDDGLPSPVRPGLLPGPPPRASASPLKLQATPGSAAPPPRSEPQQTAAPVAPLTLRQASPGARDAIEIDLGGAELPELPAEAILDVEPVAPHPIADLVGSGAENEIELLSISSDDLIAVPPSAVPPSAVPPIAVPQIAATGADLDAAFGAILPAASAQPPRPPPRVPLFDDLPQAAFVELVNRLTYRRYSPSAQILREGEPGRSFFVIVEGRVRVFKSQPGGGEFTLAHLHAGAFFGEMALLSGAPRTANVVAEEDTEVLEVTDQVLRDVVGKFPQVGAALKGFYRQRLLNNVMAISPLFKDFDPAERKAIVQRFRLRQAAGGEVLIAEGKSSDGLYVVLHGAVSVEVQAAALSDAPVEAERALPVARLKEGDLFGEMSLLTRKPATATVTAIGNCILLKLPRENFQELVLTHPQILELVSTLTEQRQSATEAILHGHGPGIDGMAFV